MLAMFTIYLKVVHENFLTPQNANNKRLVLLIHQQQKPINALPNKVFSQKWIFFPCPHLYHKTCLFERVRKCKKTSMTEWQKNDDRRSFCHRYQISMTEWSIGSKKKPNRPFSKFSHGGLVFVWQDVLMIRRRQQESKVIILTLVVWVEKKRK